MPHHNDYRQETCQSSLSCNNDKSAKWNCGSHTLICKKNTNKKNLINHDI